MSKELKRKLALIFIPPVASVIIRVLYHLNKKSFYIEKEDSNKPLVFAVWHGDLLMLPYLYFQYRKKPFAKVIISDHFDGQIISKTIKYFKLQTIQGSTRKGGAKALIEAIKAVKNGYDIGITPDGPKGPRHKANDGAAVIAQKADTKIVAVRIEPTKYWQFDSWDKFKVPKPFGEIKYYAKIIDVKNLELGKANALLEKSLGNGQ